MHSKNSQRFPKNYGTICCFSPDTYIIRTIIFKNLQVICPKCGNENTKVLESRLIENGISIRRRRECLNCDFRFTTFERIEKLHLNVLKADNSIERYNREKLEESLVIACNKQ